MNKKKNRKKMRHWKKKKNWIISFHSDTCFRKRRYKNNSNDQEKRFALNKLFRKHRYTTRFSPRHRVKANRIRVFCVNNLKWNSFEWFRIIRFIKKKFRKRKKKKITKIKFKKKKIITIRDAKVNLSKGKITYAKITKSISGIKIRIKAYWVKLRYRKFFNKHFYRWSYYKNLNNKNFHFYENLLIKIL
jgi:hypothetical protein